MAENKQYITQIQENGSVMISEDVISTIVAHAVAEVEGIVTIGKSAFEHCTSLTSITLPKSLTEIGDSAFESCNILTSVTLPNSLNVIGAATFAYCYKLTDIELPEKLNII